MNSANHSKAVEAEVRASRWLADANEHAAAGRKEAAEKCYAKAQYWLDRFNKLAGRA